MKSWILNLLSYKGTPEIFHNKGFAFFFFFFFEKEIYSLTNLSVGVGCGTLSEDLYSAVFQFANYKKRDMF